MKILGIILIALSAVTGCKKQQMDTSIIPAAKTDSVAAAIPDGNNYTYLALGDSYTIGESVSADQSFPAQLASQLTYKGYYVASPTIIARTGWTTIDLKRAIADAAITKQFSFVTLLIGVNNQYQGMSTANYRPDFVALLNTAIGFAGGNKSRVFVVSIPDWSVTPYASGRDRVAISSQIDQFNAINAEESGKAGVTYINITNISREAATDASLLANDGLHPSAKMYGLWVQQLLPKVMASLKGN